MRYLTLLLLINFIVINAKAQQNDETLIGTWRHTQLKIGNHPAEKIKEDIQKIKFVTQLHYSMVVYTSNDKLTRLTFGGDYKFDGQNYQEVSTFNSNGPNNVGEVFAAKISFNSPDQLLITYGEGENKMEEIWDRVKEPLAKNSVQISIEKIPEFPGGIAAFVEYIKSNLKYPPQAAKEKIQGKVIVAFVVDVDGSITDVNVVEGIGGGCDEEAVRLFKTSPKWQPGYQNNKPVKVAFTMPINFSTEK